MDLGLAGKRALVGGAGSGIGAGIAGVLAAEQVRVALIDRSQEGLERKAAAIGGSPVVADLSHRDGPATAVQLAVEALGGLDLLVVNSGGPPAGTFEQIGEDDWVTAIEGTLQAALRLVRESLTYLREGSDPAILFNLSSSVREPIPGLVTSNVLRPGLVGLVKSLTSEIAPVRINGIAPGRIDTERVRSLDRGRAERDAAASRRSKAAPKAASRSVATAGPTRSVMSRPSSCRRPPRSSPAPSCRSMEG